MAYLTSRSRAKGIGVRKVNGAHTLQVMLLLNKNYLKWVIFAFVVAAPIAWYLLRSWLRNFAYRISLGWWVVVLVGAMAMLISLIIVSWQTWKLAKMNPVDAIRYE